MSIETGGLFLPHNEERYNLISFLLLQKFYFYFLVVIFTLFLSISSFLCQLHSFIPETYHKWSLSMKHAHEITE